MASSSFDTFFAASVAPALMTQHGETVTHWPKGQESSAADVTAIWEPDETPQRETGDLSTEQTTYTGNLYVSSSVETHDEDKWVIDEVLYVTLTRSAVNAGLRTLLLQKVERNRTSRHNRGSML